MFLEIKLPNLTWKLKWPDRCKKIWYCSLQPGMLAKFKDRIK